jgi:cell division protein FtsQ
MSGVKRRPRAASVGRPSRAALLLRRARRVLRPLAWAACGFVGVVLVAILLHDAAPASRGAGLRAGLAAVLDMRVRHVVIEGRTNTPEPLLRAAIGATPGQPILGYSVEAARRRIESLSWVSRATVERLLPNTIVVHLDERRPFAIWQDHGRFLLIDRAGEVVAHQDLAAFKTLPLVVGAGAPEHAGALIDALRAATPLAGRVAAAVRVGRRRWNLQLANGIDVLLPEEHAPEAVARLGQLQAAHDLLDRPLAIVDLRLRDRLVIRPLPAPPPPAANTGTSTRRPT